MRGQWPVLSQAADACACLVTRSVCTHTAENVVGNLSSCGRCRSHAARHPCGTYMRTQRGTARNFSCWLPPLQPPLGAAVSCWEGLNIRIAAVVGGLHFGSLGGAGPGGLQLWGSVGVRSQRSRQQGHEALTVAAGHVGAAPAPPLGDEVVNVIGEDVEAAVLLRQLVQHDMVRHLQQQGEAAGTGGPFVAAGAGSQAQAVTAAAAAAAAAAAEPSWEEARQQRLAAAAPAHWADGCSRGAVMDSPSEMCASPQPTGGLQQQAQQVRHTQQDGLGGGSGWAGTDAATQAALREAATVAAALGAAGADDFMHPAHWVEARQQLGSGPGSRLRREDSTSSQDGHASSVHSFLLPGRRFSSEDDSQAGSDAPYLPPAAPQLRPTAAAEAWAPAARLSEGSLQLQPEPGGQAVRQQAAAAADLAAVQAVAPRTAGASGFDGGAAVGTEVDAALPLFGRGDHQADATRPLSTAQRLQLALRAVQLLAMFLPFLLLGPLLLVLAAQLDSAAARRQQRQQVAQQLQPQALLVQEDGDQGFVVANVVAQPAAREEAVAVPSGAASRLRTAAFKLLLGACRRRQAGRAARVLPAHLAHDRHAALQASRHGTLSGWPLGCLILCVCLVPGLCSGAAFIKWGQWASTREDIFPQARARGVGGGVGL